MTKSTRKKLNFKFIRINTRKEGYDVYYKIGRRQKFITEFKNKKIKELENEL